MADIASSGRRTPTVALLRGINVGGKNLLPMKELTAIFAKAECTEVRTYIQSGNVLFNAPAALVKKLPDVISERIRERFGYSVPVILRTIQEMGKVISENPFLEIGDSEKMLHVYFLGDKPAASAIQSLDPDRSPPDTFQVRNREIYLRCPNGMGRSKLTNAYFDAKLSTISTARNWATVVKLFEMMQI